jgi:hypothetical protein
MADRPGGAEGADRECDDGEDNEPARYGDPGDAKDGERPRERDQERGRSDGEHGPPDREDADDENGVHRSSARARCMPLRVVEESCRSRRLACARDAPWAVRDALPTLAICDAVPDRLWRGRRFVRPSSG